MKTALYVSQGFKPLAGYCDWCKTLHELLLTANNESHSSSLLPFTFYFLPFAFYLLPSAFQDRCEPLTDALAFMILAFA
jgi:hypothetical protein